MTYDLDWRIVSPGQATAEQITAYYRKHAEGGLAYVNSLRHSRGEPPLKLNLIPDDIGETIIAASRTWPEQVVNHDGLAVQGGKESAFLQSEIARDKLNPSGLGASNDDPYDNAITCSSWLEGFTLTVAHLLSYAVGDGPWAAVDPRWKYMTVKSRGTRPRWVDLNGYWAVPGTGYGQSIIQRANDDLLTIGGGSMAAQIPGFTWQPADDRHHTKGRSKKISGFAVHYTGGTNSLAWLTTTSGYNADGSRSTNHDPVSAHFLIKHSPTMEDRGWQLVRIEDTAWTTGGNVNPIAVSFEFEQMEGQPISDVAYQVMAQTILDVAQYVAEHRLGEIKINREAIKGHKEWVGDNRVCPDGVDVDRIVEIAQGRQAPRVREFDTGYALSGGFLAFYERAEGCDTHWSTIGVPQGDEIPNVDNGEGLVTVQQTDVGWLQWNPATGEVRMATRAQAQAIRAALGIEPGNDVRWSEVERLLSEARKAHKAEGDWLDAAAAEVGA